MFHLLSGVSYPLTLPSTLSFLWPLAQNEVGQARPQLLTPNLYSYLRLLHPPDQEGVGLCCNNDLLLNSPPASAAVRQV